MILYLTEQGAKVSKESQRFKISFSNKKGKVQEVRINTIDEIYVFGNISFTPQVIQTCLKEGIGVYFFTFSGSYLGKLQGLSRKNIELRILQFNTYFNSEKRLKFAKTFVWAKALNQKHFLLELKKRYSLEVLKGISYRMEVFIKELDKAQSVEEVMGTEGILSRTYFEGLSYVFKKLGWKFEGRKKRPPGDAVNALLSFGYTLLFSKVLGFVESSGLDPYLGFLHSPDYGKPSLALDLMEEWRTPIVDTVVIRCLAWKTIKPSDFTEDFHLTPLALKKFITQFQAKLQEKLVISGEDKTEEKELTYLKAIKHQVYAFIKALKSDKEYTPFVKVEE